MSTSHQRCLVALMLFPDVSFNSAILLARDAFVKTNRRAIAMMFFRLPGTGVHYDHVVHFSMD